MRGTQRDLARWERRRPFPGVRIVRTALRTAHLISFAALFGGHVYAVSAQALRPALWATVLSGGVLTAVEIYRTPAWPLQVRGVATFAKVLLVAAVAVYWEARVALLTTAIVIGGVVSHMPGRYRYYSVLHGTVIGDDERG
jgi:hypothetical protein